MDKKLPTHIAEEAAERFARHMPGAHPAEPSDDLDAWLQADPAHAREYAQTREVWDQLGGLAGRPELRRLRSQDLSALRKERWRDRAPMLGMAAVLALVLGAGYLWLGGLTAPTVQAFATLPGEQRTEVLLDGSHVVLNTDSAIRSAYDGAGREIDLLQGEAQFDVVRDAARPFVVHSGPVSVAALGTRFQVRRAGTETLVTLLEGSVEVALGEQRFRLRPGQRAHMSQDGVVSISRVEAEVAEGWLEGWLRFRGTPLSDVVAEANRYPGPRLRIGSPDLAGVLLSGDFRVGEGASIANAARLILPVDVEQRDGELVLVPAQR